MPGWVLAKGKVIDLDQEMKCDGCAKAAEAGQGFCEHCSGGIVAGRYFQGRDSYDQAVTALVVIEKASKAHCEECAVALLTDGKCEHCNVQYKHGEKIG
jgi:hypothetical protein